MTKFSKFVSATLMTTTAVWASGVFMMVPVASAQSTADLQAQIAALLAQIQQLQVQLNAAQSGASVSSSYSYTRDLTVGSKGDDVSALQQMLIGGGYLKISAPTGYFGSLTKAALAAWQSASSISPAAGYFGPKSRAYVASLAVSTPSTPSVPGVVVPSGTDLYVALASDSPAAVVLGSGTSFNPVLKFNLTAGSKDVKVTSLRIAKSGFVANTNISGVDVVDSAGVRHGNVISSISADNDVLVLMDNSPVVVKAGQTERLTVRVNLGSGATSGTVSFSIANASAIKADTSAVGGSFPVSGSSFTLASGASVATVTLDVRSIGSDMTLNVDSANWQEITKFRLSETSSREAVKLVKWSLYNYGNANQSDYGDVQLVLQDGTVLATAQPSGQNVVFDLSASPYELGKGLSKDFTVRAKLLGGTTRTIQLVTYNDYDVVVSGKDSGVSVLAAAVSGGTDSSFPIGDASLYNKVTIGQGTIVFNKDASSPSAAVVPGSTGVVLAKYYVKPSGENMELRQVSFGLVQSSTALTGTVYVKVNDSIVYSEAASGFATSGTAATKTLSSYPILTSGQNNYISVEVSISSNAAATDSYYVNDFNLIQAKRLITNDLITPSTSATDGNTIAVKAAILALTTLSTPVAASVVAGTNDFEFARFQLDSSAGGEDVKVSKIIVTDTLATSTTYTGVNNLVMYKDGVSLPTSGSTATNAATVTFTFVTPITVSRSAPVTLSLKANVISATGVSHTYKVNAIGDITATGVSTGNSLSGSSQLSVAGVGQAMAVVSAGSLALSLVSGSGASPSANQLVSLGATNQTVFAFKLASSYEAQKISVLKLTWSGTSLDTNDVLNLKLYKGSETTAFATAAQAASCSSNTCYYTWNWPDNWGAGAIQPSSPLTIYVKADIGSQGQAKLGNDFIFSIASTSDITSKGVTTGTSASSISGTPTVAGISYISPFSVLVTGESPSAGSSVTQTVTSGTTIGRFKATNNGSAQVTLTKVTFTDNGTNSTSSELYKLYYSDENSANYTQNNVGTSTSVDFGASLSITLNGGSYRYFTVTVESATGLASGDSFNLAVASLGNVRFTAADSNLLYDGNVDGSATSGSTTGLYADGKPVLGTIVKQ